MSEPVTVTLPYSVYKKILHALHASVECGRMMRIFIPNKASRSLKHWERIDELNEEHVGRLLKEIGDA